METPRQILQRHAIEISPDERRTTEEVVLDLIERGLVTPLIETSVEIDESTL